MATGSSTSCRSGTAGGHFNCWSSIPFGTTDTIMVAHHGFKPWTLGGLVHAGRTTDRDWPHHDHWRQRQRALEDWLSAEPETALRAL
jgi:hypothetical protein